MTQAVLDQLLMIIFVTVIGYIAAKAKMITPEICKGLSELLVSIAIPAMLLSSSQTDLTDELFVNVMWILIASVISYIVLIGIMQLLFVKTNLTRKEKGLYTNLTIFANVAFLGYPVISSIMPEYGIFYASFGVMIFQLFVQVYAAYAFSGDKKLNIIGLLKNVSVVAIVLMFIIFFLQIKLPTSVNDGISSLGSLCTPVSLLIIGAKMASADLLSLITDKKLYIISVAKLLVIPAVTAGVMYLINAPYEVAVTMTVLAAMPSASINVVFAEKYENDTQYASKLVTQSTLLFVLSFPIIVTMINWLF